MSADKPSTASEMADAAQSGETAPHRLVIRVKIVREESSEATASRPLDKRALVAALGIGVIVVLTLVWIVASVFNDDAASNSTASLAPSEEAPRSLTQVPTPNEAAVAVKPEPVSPEVEEQPDVPPAPINEVMPNVPRSALHTIRGTVRVAIRVVIGGEGTVLAATSEIPGPSRYFERIALQTAKEWVFTPAAAQDDREMLVRFYFRRDGVTAHAEPIAAVEPVVSDGTSPL